MYSLRPGFNSEDGSSWRHLRVPLRLQEDELGFTLATSRMSAAFFSFSVLKEQPQRYFLSGANLDIQLGTLGTRHDTNTIFVMNYGRGFSLASQNGTERQTDGRHPWDLTIIQRHTHTFKLKLSTVFLPFLSSCYWGQNSKAFLRYWAMAFGQPYDDSWLFFFCLHLGPCQRGVSASISWFPLSSRLRRYRYGTISIPRTPALTHYLRNTRCANHPHTPNSSILLLAGSGVEEREIRRRHKVGEEKERERGWDGDIHPGLCQAGFDARGN